MEKAIYIKDLHFKYHKEQVLKGVNLEINSGEVISLLGANGSGKSTLMKLILGLLKADTGLISIEGSNVSKLSSKEIAKKIAYVPQENSTPFAYSALDMVLMGRTVHKGVFERYTKKDKEIALEAMEKLRVADLKDKPFTKLSGGQQQLIILSRAITQGAKILILDEPVTGLDYGNQLRLLQKIYDLSNEGYTFIKSTHFPDHSLMINGRAIMLNDGKIFADGKAESVITKENIEKMYGVSVEIAEMSNGFRMCVPSFLTTT